MTTEVREIDLPGSLGIQSGRRRVQRWVARWPLGLAVVAIATVIGISISPAWSNHAKSAPHKTRASPTAALPAAGLPTLGEAFAVEVNNPALNDVGDPYVLPIPAGVDGIRKPGYALYWTTDWTANVPTAVSTDLIHWRRVPDALPVLPSWAKVVEPPGSWSAPSGVSTLTWGPTVHQVPGGWVLYYSTEDASTMRECIGAAFSSNPTGPFVDRSTKPLVCQFSLGGDIDPSVVATTAGHLALIWKNDGNSNDTPVSIWEQPLRSDGRSVMGRPARLITADQAWEHRIVEGPSMLADTRGGWWLFFSGGTWQSDTYDTGVTWCVTVAGPCNKPAQAPFLASTSSSVSPGGLDTFVDHNGNLWASYSAFPTAPQSAQAAMASPRVLELARVLSH